MTLLRELGWNVALTAARPSHPEGRTARLRRRPRGPRARRRPAVLRLVMAMVGRGVALVRARQPREQARPARSAARTCTVTPRAGRVARAARGRAAATVAPRRSDGRRLVSHAVLDGGKLVVAHAGLPEEHARAAARAGPRASRSTATPRARPTSSACPSATRLGARLPRARPTVVYGHTPVPERGVGQPHDLHRHRLRVRRRAHRAALARSASSSPCPPRATYYEPAPPAGPGRRRSAAGPAARPRRRRRQADRPDPPRAARSPIREENAAAALEVMSRFADRPALARLPAADDGRPPTTSQRPASSSTRREAFADYRARGRHAASCARRSTWARARSRSCAATRRPRGRRFGVADGTPARSSTRAPAGRSSTTPQPRSLERARAAPRPRRPVGRAGDRLAGARLRAAAVVGEGAGADLRASTRRSARRAPRRSRRAPSLLERRSPARRRRRRRCSSRTRGSRRARGAVRRRLPPLLLARRRPRRTCGSRRSSVLAARGARPRRATTTRLAPGDARRRASSSRPRTAPLHRRRVVDLDDAGRRGRTAAAVVGGADRRAAARAWSSSRCDVARGAAGSSSRRIKCRGREYLRIIYGARVRPSPSSSSGSAPVAWPQARPGAARVRPRARGASSASCAREPLLPRSTSASSRVLALESEPVDPRL